MTRPDPNGLIAVLWDEALPPRFQANTLLFMAVAVITRPDPDAYLQDWFDQAGEGDETHLVWAMRAWQHIRTSPQFVCELIEREARELRRAAEAEDVAF